MVAIIVYLAWGRNCRRQRKEKKAKAVEDEIAMRKLGDEESVSEWGGYSNLELGGGRVHSAKKAATMKWWNR